MQGHGRKLAVLACYMPPNLLAAKAASCLEYIEELVIEMKRRLKDPYIVVCGDFNQWKLPEALQEFRDLKEVNVGPTRGDKAIDRTFTNFAKITEAATLNPLQPDSQEGSPSDHRLS